MKGSEFTVFTKRRLAERAGYMCSLCGRLTVGPSTESNSSVSLLGDAAHIAAAKPGGRRYIKDMTNKQRKDIANGIWLCKLHHKSVDSDEHEYTIQYLNTIKANHEMNVDYKNNGLRINNGLVVNVEIENIGDIKKKCNIEFSNSTLFYGANATGKTLICDIIASLHYHKKINKWLQRRNQGSSNYTISFFDVSQAKFRINYSSRNKISLSLNDALLPTIISPYYCIYFEKDFFEVTNNEDTIFQRLASYFCFEEYELIELIKFINKLDKVFINEIIFKDEDLYVKMEANSPETVFGGLSSGEQHRVIIELGLRLACFYSQFKPTILLMEYNAVSVLDVCGVNRLFKWILEKKANFQFVFTYCRDIAIFNTNGHRVYKLINKEGNVEIEMKGE